MQVYIEKRDSHKQRKTENEKQRAENGKQKRKTCIGYKNKCSITFRIS